MNRRSIQQKKLQIEEKLLPVGKRILSLEKTYKATMAEIEALPAEDPKREELAKRAAQEYVDLQRKNAEFTALMQEHNGLTATQTMNRNTIVNGQKVRDGKADPHNRDIPPAGLHST